MKVKLRDFVELVKTRVDIKDADVANYISTDNMLPNRGGVEFGNSKLPTTKTVNNFIKGDVLISNIRPYFKKIWLADRSGTRSSDVLCFRATNEKLSKEYLYCVLQSDSFFNYVMSTSKGTKMPRGDKEAILDYEFELVSKEEQYDKYHSILLLERKIYLNNRINDNLFEIANLIFENQLNNDCTKLSNIATIQNGYAFKSKEYISQKQLLILRTKNIESNHLFNKSDVVYINQDNFCKYKKFAFNKFDTALVMVGANIGKTGFITSNVLPALQNQNMWRFRSKDSKMPGLLLYEYVNYINKKVQGYASGSARSFYRKKVFSDFEVPIIDSNFFKYFERIQFQINNITW